MEKWDDALKAAEKAAELADDEIKVRYESKVQQIKKVIEKNKQK